MYEKILELIIRVNADITLSSAAKEEINMLLDTCSTEKELSQIEDSLDLYWWNTAGVIADAMARKTYQELEDIYHMMDQMVTGTRNIVETSIRRHEGSEVQSLLTSY